MLPFSLVDKFLAFFVSSFFSYFVLVPFVRKPFLLALTQLSVSGRWHFGGKNLAPIGQLIFTSIGQIILRYFLVIT